MNLAIGFDVEFCLRLTLTLLHFLWQGSLIAGLAVAAGYLLRRASAAARYRLFLAALLIMAFAPPATFLMLGRPRNAIAVASTTPLSSNISRDNPIVESDNAPVRVAVSGASDSPAVAADPSAPSVVSRPRRSLAERAMALVSAENCRRAAPLVAIAYFAGLVLMLVRLLLALRGGRGLRGESRPVADAQLVASLNRAALAVGLRFVPALSWCERVAVPTVIGIVKPVILLPLSLDSGLTPAQVEMLLLHELAHLRRGDHWVNLVQWLVETALFFHPGVWLISSRIRSERELASDDMVLAAGVSAPPYAESLLRMAELCRGCVTAEQVSALALGSHGHRFSGFGQRILRLIEGRDALESIRPARVWPLAGALMLFMAACLSFAVRSEAQEPGAPTAAAAVRPQNYAEIQKIIEERVGRISSVKLKYKVEEIRKAGSMNDEARMNGATLAPGEMYPEKDTPVHASGEIIIKGDSSREDRVSDTWHVPDVRLVPGRKSTTIVHNHRTITLRDGTDHATIEEHMPGEFPYIVEVAAVLNCFGKVPVNGYQGSAPSLLRWETSETGSPLAIVGNTDFNSVPRWSGATRQEAALDASRDYVPIQIKSMSPQGKVAVSSTIEYARQADGTYVPTAATVKLGMLKTTRTLTVTQISLNEEIPDSAFDITFPSSTHIGDRISELNYRIESDADLEKRAAENEATRRDAQRKYSGKTEEERVANWLAFNKWANAVDLVNFQSAHYTGNTKEERMNNYLSALSKLPDLPSKAAVLAASIDMTRAQKDSNAANGYAPMWKISDDFSTRYPETIESDQLAATLAAAVMDDQPDQARRLFQNLQNSADRQIQTQAQRSLQTMDMLGKPLIVQFDAVDGRKVDSTALKGKVVLVEFWATSSTECLAVLPAVKAAYEKYHDAGLEILGVGSSQSQAQVEAFIKEQGIAWPQGFELSGDTNRLSKSYNVRSRPTLLLIDRAGNLAYANAVVDLERKIEKLLAESPTPSP